MSVIYKLVRPEVKVDSDGVITATLSTEAEDRDGDVIRANGWQLDHFSKHPVLLSSHDYGDARKQIGEWRNVRVVNGKLVGEPHYYHDMGNDEADWAYKIARMGKAAYSVGFAPVEDNPRKGGGGREYTKQELLEASHVTIPSNREALQLMAKSVQAGPIADVVQELLGGESVTKDGPVQCCVSGCDDMSSAHVGICADHLKALTQLNPNPGGSVYGRALDEILDTQIRELYSAGRQLRGFAKAGRTISGGNMDRLHHALSDLHALHDPNCNDESCAYAPSDDDGDGKGAHLRLVKADGPYEPEPYHADPDETVKCPKCGKMNDVDAAYCDQCGAKLAGRDDVTVGKAMGEDSGSAGGVTVHSDGSHAPFDGTHSHAHPAFGSQGDDASHAHDHSHDGDASHDHSHAEKALKAPMSTADINDLPDSAFAVILPGGTKDAEGKTVPRSNRLLPHHKADGSLDLPHLKEVYAEHKNALARVSQIDAPADVKAAAQKHLEAHAKEAKIGDYADDGKGFDIGTLLGDAMEAAMKKASRQLEVK